MPDVTKIKLPDGTVCDIKDTVSGYTSNSGTVTGVKINNETKSPTSGIVDLGTVLSSYTETDPTVPSWAKASQKPTYAASEITVSNYSDWPTVQSAIAGLASGLDELESDKVSVSTVGAANGVVPLNASSKIDESYLPSYVDDVIEGYYYNSKFWKESSHTTEITGEAGKIYVDLSTDKTYRFGGTSFVEISSGTTVSVTRDLTSGTKIATITVNGTGSSLYAPTPPSKVSELSNDSGFISGISSADVTSALGYTPYNSTNPSGYVNAAGASAAAPVQSVNGQTGAVTLSASDVGALPSNTVIPTVTNTYSSTGTDAVSGTAVYSALQTLDSSITATANSAISAITITDGKISSSSKIAIPSKVSDLTNDAGYISVVPVTSVNSQTGDVVIDSDVVYVIFNRTSSDSSGNVVSATKTPQEVLAAFQNGKTVIGIDNYTKDLLYLKTTSPIVALGDISAIDGQANDYNINRTYYLGISNTAWQLYLETNSVIKSSALTSIINSSSTSDQVPTAKAIYDAAYISLGDLPIYDGAVQSNARGVEF